MIERIARAVAFANEWAVDEADSGVIILVPLDDGPVPIGVEPLERAGERPAARLWTPVALAETTDPADCLRRNAEIGIGSLASRGNELGLTTVRFVNELDPRDARALFEALARQARELQQELAKGEHA